MQLTDNSRGALYMSVAMAAFTLNDTCMKAVSADVPLYQAIVLRGVVALVALLLIAWRMGALSFRLAPEDRKWIALRSFSEVAGTLTFLTALRHMPLANLSAIMQFLPLAVTLSAALFLREAVGWRRLMAILVGFAGVLLIVRPGTEGFDRWSLLGLASVACVTLRDLSTRRLSSAMPSAMVALYAALSVLIAAMFLLPISGVEPVSLRAGILLAAAAAFLIVGYLVIVLAMRVGDIGLVAPFRYTALIFAVVLGWAFFGQLPDGLTMMGAAIVIATGIYTFRRERRLGQRIAVPTKAPFRMR